MKTGRVCDRFFDFGYLLLRHFVTSSLPHFRTSALPHTAYEQGPPASTLKKSMTS
jgi:hypothetical protein